MGTTRFHLDENVDHDVARGLRLRGIDVTTAVDAGLRGAEDESHLAFALEQRRVVFTSDADFLRLADRGIDHHGIVYCPAKRRSIGEQVRFLCLLHDSTSAEEMRGRVEFA